MTPVFAGAGAWTKWTVTIASAQSDIRDNTVRFVPPHPVFVLGNVDRQMGFLENLDI